MGDKALGAQTPDRDDPYYDIDEYKQLLGPYTEMYIVHNNPTGSIFYADEFCAETRYAKQLEINPSKQELTVDGISGTRCKNCFLNAGSALVVGMRCYNEDSTNCKNNVNFRDVMGDTCGDWPGFFCDKCDGTAASSCDDYSDNDMRAVALNCPESCGLCRRTFCDYKVSVEGGFEYNFDFQMTNPVFQGSGNTADVWEGGRMTLGSLSILDELLVLELGATPSLRTSTTSVGSGVGTMLMTSSAKGQSD